MIEFAIQATDVVKKFGDFTAIDGVNDMFSNINSENQRTRTRDHSCGRQTNITKPQNSDIWFFFRQHYLVTPICIIPDAEFSNSVIEKYRK